MYSSYSCYNPIITFISVDKVILFTNAAITRLGTSSLKLRVPAIPPIIFKVIFTVIVMGLIFAVGWLKIGNQRNLN